MPNISHLVVKKIVLMYRLNTQTSNHGPAAGGERNNLLINICWVIVTVTLIDSESPASLAMSSSCGELERNLVTRGLDQQEVQCITFKRRRRIGCRGYQVVATSLPSSLVRRSRGTPGTTGLTLLGCSFALAWIPIFAELFTGWFSFGCIHF